METEGSVENARRVRLGTADLGLVQASRSTLAGVSAIAPLYADVFVVVARAGSGIVRLADFSGRTIAIGRSGSGVHVASVPLLARHGVRGGRLSARSQSFADLETDPSLDGALSVTGLLNPELGRVLAGGRFVVIPVEDSDAIGVADPFLFATQIPLGMFGASPMVPAQPVPTVATTAVLVVGAGASDDLVHEALAALYEDDLRVDLPTLIPASVAREFTVAPMHPAARSYHNPYEGVETVSNAVQTLDAGKELLVALGAAVYLVVGRMRRRTRREQAVREQTAADALDVYLERTVAIERSVLSESDGSRLVERLAEVSAIKLEALERLANETLRSDWRFLIFLTQCESLAQAIRGKLKAHVSSDPAGVVSALPHDVPDALGL